MNDMQNLSFVMYLVCAMHIAAYLIACFWMFRHRKEQHDRSRIFICLLSLYLVCSGVIFIATGMSRNDLDGFMNTILEPYPMIFTFLPTLMLPFYILEVEQSHWLNLRHFAVLVSPWALISLGWITYHGIHHWQYDAITHLSDINQIIPAIHLTDVQLRLLSAGIYLPYPIALLFVRHNWKTCNVERFWLRWLKFLSILSPLLFVLGLPFRIKWAYFANFICLDLASVSVFVIELTARIPVPQSEPEPPAVETNPARPQLSYLAQRLLQMLEHDCIWQNPELQRDDVCHLLGTNRTYLSPAIQELGYSNFQDMINRQRTRYVHDELLKDPSASLSDVFFRAGYRSRSTATRCFTQAYGCSPSDFLRRQKR